MQKENDIIQLKNTIDKLQKQITTYSLESKEHTMKMAECQKKINESKPR